MAIGLNFINIYCTILDIHVVIGVIYCVLCYLLVYMMINNVSLSCQITMAHG